MGHFLLLVRLQCFGRLLSKEECKSSSKITNPDIKEFVVVFMTMHYSRLQKTCNVQAEHWKTTIHLPHMNLIIFPPPHALPLCSSTINQLWFSTFQLACCKTFAICCKYNCGIKKGHHWYKDLQLASNHFLFCTGV